MMQYERRGKEEVNCGDYCAEIHVEAGEIEAVEAGRESTTGYEEEKRKAAAEIIDERKRAPTSKSRKRGPGERTFEMCRGDPCAGVANCIQN